LAELQQTVYPHSGHPSAEGRAHDRVSSRPKTGVPPTNQIGVGKSKYGVTGEILFTGHVT